MGHGIHATFFGFADPQTTFRGAGDFQPSGTGRQDRSMDNHILNRVNSYIKVRKERTEAFAIILIVLPNDW